MRSAILPVLVRRADAARIRREALAAAARRTQRRATPVTTAVTAQR
jgi:hypothetical protein